MFMVIKKRSHTAAVVYFLWYSYKNRFTFLIDPLRTVNMCEYDDSIKMNSESM